MIHDIKLSAIYITFLGVSKKALSVRSLFALSLKHPKFGFQTQETSKWLKNMHNVSVLQML